MLPDLVADIGATNARFQLVADGALTGEAAILPTASFSRGADLLNEALLALGAEGVRRAAFGVAGPVDAAGNVVVTNTGLALDATALSDLLDAPCRLINDFQALASGVPYLSSLAQLGGDAGAQGNKAVLGPGSGLGMAGLVAGAAGWIVVPSEGGHADLAPASHLETELWSILQAQHNHVCWETVLSGPGLSHLHAAMAAVWGGRAEVLSAAEVTERGLDMSDPVCHQTLETFCALLGAAAGNLALTLAAWGGVYIGGGIVPRMLDFVMKSPLRRRFEERGAYSELASTIPLYVITQQDAGLVGAVRCLDR